MGVRGARKRIFVAKIVGIHQRILFDLALVMNRLRSPHQKLDLASCTEIAPAVAPLFNVLPINIFI